MLSILSDDRREYVWHVGEAMPPMGPMGQIDSVAADGHELEFIRQHFSNIPMTDSRIIVWYGDVAMFIANNIKLVNPDQFKTVHYKKAQNK